MTELAINELVRNGVSTVMHGDVQIYNGVDACFVLEFGNWRKAISEHVDLECQIKFGPCVYLTEKGILSLLMASNSFFGKNFKRWVLDTIMLDHKHSEGQSFTFANPLQGNTVTFKSP